MLHKQARGAKDNPPMKAARIKKLRVFVLPMGRSESQDLEEYTPSSAITSERIVTLRHTGKE
jgi:hypothetical protein